MKRKLSVIITLVAAISLPTLSNARRQPLEDERYDMAPPTSPGGEQPLLGTPLVGREPIKFGNNDYYWQIDMTPTVLRIGWQTEQTANSKDLTFAYNPANY